MTRIFFILLIISFLPIQTSAQLKSNEYYEVLDSCINVSRATLPLEDGRLISYPKKSAGTGSVYLLDKNNIKTALPCDRAAWPRHSTRDCFQCIKNGKSAFFPLKPGQSASPFYDSLRVINSNFYMVWQKDSLYAFNAQHERLFQMAADISKRGSKQFFEHCTNQLLKCTTNEEEFYLNTKGEISKDGVCEIELQRIYHPDGTYQFKQDQKWGLKNKDGAILLAANYKRIDQWQNAKYIVAVQKGENGKYFYGVVDQDGKALLPLEYESISAYDFGLKVRKEGCKNTFLDTNLKNKYDKEFDELRVSKCGLIRGKIGGQKFYDLLFTEKVEGTEGKIVSAKGITDERCEVLYESGRYVIYDQSGNTLFSNEGEASASRIYENVLQIELNSATSGLIDAAGQWIVEPGNYSFKSTRLTDGIYKVNLDSRQSDLINSKGELIYPNVQNGGLIPTKGNYIVSNDQGRAVVSPSGKLLIPFGEYRIHEFSSGPPQYYRLISGNVAYVVRLK